jgi:hypothetical protein
VVDEKVAAHSSPERFAVRCFGQLPCAPSALILV